MTTPLLDVRGVHAGHGAAEVLFGIDLAVAPGEIVGVLGRNGMGKTTLVRTIMGLLRPRAGTIALAGRDITGRAPPGRPVAWTMRDLEERVTKRTRIVALSHVQFASGTPAAVRSDPAVIAAYLGDDSTAP